MSADFHRTPDETPRQSRRMHRSPARESERATGLPLFLQPVSRAPRSVQRAPDDGATASLAPASTADTAPAAAPATAASSPTDAQAAAPALIVDDRVTDLAPGQMRRGEFLAALHAEVSATAEQALSGTIWSAIGCPYIDRWFAHYGAQSAEQVEQTLRRYVPEAAGANSARDYIPLVCGRVRSAITAWTTTGEVPPNVAGLELPGAGEAPGGGGISRIVGLFFKTRDGQPSSGARRVSPRLGAGRPLDGGSRTRMERAFGRSFGDVRIHTDPDTAALSEEMHARAFTVGEHVGFGPGEYQPGTLLGDALLAHELAHVAQQGGASAPASSDELTTESPTLEEEADRSALGVVASLWGTTSEAASVFGANARLALRTGLRLQRCKSEAEKAKEAREAEIKRLGGLQYDFLEKQRKEEEERLKKEAEEDAKKKGMPAPAVAPKVTLEDTLKGQVAKGAYQQNPVAAWTSLSAADQAAWKTRAAAAWSAVVASVAGTELEKAVQGKTFLFDPETALKWGWYAWRTGTTLGVGMSWVTNVEADPKNAWPNIAHELGGHFEYGTPYASEIMNAAIDKMPAADQTKWRTDPTLKKQFYETYEYPETEIFAAIRERRYSKPEVGTAPTYGGLPPDTNVPANLKKMKTYYHPDVAKAVLKELRNRIEAHPEITARDKKWFVEQVKIVFGYEP